MGCLNPTLSSAAQAENDRDCTSNQSALQKGKGIHLIAKLYRKLRKVTKNCWKYALAKENMGEHNSFSKTDPDATMKHMKYDYYNHTHVFKYGYNLQIRVNHGYVAYTYISSDANDMKTYIPFLEGFKKCFSDYPKMTVADAGYGSFMNYTYAQKHDIRGIMKYSGYEKKRSMKKIGFN